MIHAIQSNRIAPKITFNEDTFTSSVFGQLLYLPSEVLWQILTEAAYTKDLPCACGEIESFEFWPKWDGTGTPNSRFVEPDCFIRFGQLDLIVEAKRRDDFQQSSHQWKSQFRAYLNEYGDQGKPVYFLAVGGLHHESALPLAIEERNSTVFMCRWSRILRAVRQAIRQWERCSYTSSASQAQLRVLSDLLPLFAMHGHATGEWLEHANIGAWRSRGQVKQNVFKFARKTSIK